MLTTSAAQVIMFEIRKILTDDAAIRNDGSRVLPEIRGFGSFQVKFREAREGRNPKTGEPVHISAKRTPFFKVGKELKEMVDEAPEVPENRDAGA